MLVSQEDFDWLTIRVDIVLSRQYTYLFEPGVDVLEGFDIGYIVHVNYSIGVLHVGFEHLSREGGAIYVPQLERHIDVAHQLQPFLEEVAAYCFLVVFVEVVLAVAAYHLCFANGGVPDHKNLVR